MSSDLNRLGWLIKRLQHRHHRSLDANLSRLGVSLVQWNALREIDRNPGSSQHQLAERTFNSDQAFGTLINRLQKRNLLQSIKGPGRATLHALSPSGKALLKSGQKIMTEVLHASFSPLEENERTTLTHLLTKILDAREAIKTIR